MSTAFTFNGIVVACVTGAFFLLYRTLFQAHFRKQFKQPNDYMIHVPLIRSNDSSRDRHRKKTSFAQMRCRHLTFPPNGDDDDDNDNPSSVQTRTPASWVVFVADHGDTLDVFDTLMNQLYDRLVMDTAIATALNSSRIHVVAYDRIGYGESSSFASMDGTNVCISPPRFTPLSSSERALELLSLLMNLEVNNSRFRLFHDDLILVAHGYGGLIVQSLLKILATDLRAYYPEMMVASNHLKKIKLVLLDSSWIGMDRALGKFEPRLLDAYQDYVCTLCGLHAPRMLYHYPMFDDLRQTHRHYEADIVNNVQICQYYRGYSDQLIAQWNELLGFWPGMAEFGGGDGKEWMQSINEMERKYGLVVRIVNLYCSQISVHDQINDKWKNLHKSLSRMINEKYLVVNEEIDSAHFIHLKAPLTVVKHIVSLLSP